MKSYIFFFVLFFWLSAIVLFSLVLNTSGMKEGFFSEDAQIYNEIEMQGPPSGSSLSMLSDNKVNVSCCPSSYTTSNGCVCLTKDQLESMRSRGGNRTPI